MNTNKINNNTDTNTEEEQTKLKKGKQIEEEQYRLVINKEMNDILESLVFRTNDGFEGGEVSKSELANLLLQNAAKDFGDSEIRILRSRSFDEKKILRAILRKSGDEGEIPENLKKLIREYYGLDSKERKTSKKLAQTDSKDSFLVESSTDRQAVRRTSNSNS
jgi:hypothetical protein